MLDYRLPDIDGLEFLTELSLQQKACAVIMLTGQGSELVAVQALKNGAHDYLPKNEITPATLQRALKNALQKARLNQELQEKHLKLSQSSRELEQFATVISHDLKEPLRKITTLPTYSRRNIKAS